MGNNEYNLGNMYSLRCIFIIWMVFFAFSSIVLAEDLEKSASEQVGTITDSEPSWYAIVKIDSGKKKLYTKGDIFYSEADIHKCLRIQDIKKDTLILKDVSSKDIIIVKPGEKIPLEGTDIIFEKTVETDVIEYRYKSSKKIKRDEVKDFIVSNLNRKGFLVQNLAVAGLVERSGIKQGDLIKSINGQPVNSLFGIYRTYMGIKADNNIKVVSIEIVRDGKPKRLIYKIR